MKLKTTAPKRDVKSKARTASATHNVEAAKAQNVEAKSATRSCPTRESGTQPLFQHTVTVAQCQSKQRGLYHKCFTCAHGNARG